ncbi:MAG: DNA/RNA non-specific endonuclease [Flavobacteriales bacterium]|nr:DNA/RNA non-specific endonuclease [Flavobacteriales bacterium]
MKNIIQLMLLLLTTTVVGQSRPEIHCKHFFGGFPFGAPATNDLIIHDIYALSSNDETKFADWVAYRLTIHEVDGELGLERNWKSEEWLDGDETLEASDYTGANGSEDYERGHQAPLGSFKNSLLASQTNLLSNITPQKSDLNQGPWVKLEDAVRDLILQGNKEVYVMTGPLYERTMPPLPKANETHKVPSGYWKVVILPSGPNSFQQAAFIMDQASGRNDSVISKIVSIDEVEKRSGLDLLWQLDDAQENNIEANTNMAWIKAWIK